MSSYKNVALAASSADGGSHVTEFWPMIKLVEESGWGLPGKLHKREKLTGMVLYSPCLPPRWMPRETAISQS